MPHLSIMDICDGIAGTINGTAFTPNVGAAASTIIAHSFDEVTEAELDVPLIEVIPTSSLVDPMGETDRTTFKGCVKGGEHEFWIRGFARQRSQVGEDLEAAVRMWDAIEELLEDVGTDCADPIAGDCDYFGVNGIKSFSWNAQCPITWDHDGVKYSGFQMFLRVRVF